MQNFLKALLAATLVLGLGLTMCGSAEEEVENTTEDNPGTETRATTSNNGARTRSLMFAPTPVFMLNPDGGSTVRAGTACASSVFGIPIGDASIEKAARNGNISEIAHVDSTGFSITGVYARFCTTVHGIPAPRSFIKAEPQSKLVFD